MLGKVLRKFLGKMLGILPLAIGFINAVNIFANAIYYYYWLNYDYWNLQIYPYLNRYWENYPVSTDLPFSVISEIILSQITEIYYPYHVNIIYLSISGQYFCHYCYIIIIIIAILL